MRRTALLLVLLVAAFGVVAVGCGGEQEQSATPDTVQGEVTTEPTDTTETETETTETDETETETVETVITPPSTGDPVAGKEVFLGSSACGGCHTLADAGTSGAVGPNLDDAAPSAERVAEIVTNGQGGMPSFSSSLSEQQIADVAAYISSVAGS